MADLAGGTGGRVYTASDDAGLTSAFQSAAGWFATQLDVSLDVPVALSGANSRLQITAKVGSVSATTSTPVTFDIDPNAPVTPQATVVNATGRGAYIVIGSVIFLQRCSCSVW